MPPKDKADLLGSMASEDEVAWPSSPPIIFSGRYNISDQLHLNTCQHWRSLRVGAAYYSSHGNKRAIRSSTKQTSLQKHYFRLPSSRVTWWLKASLENISIKGRRLRLWLYERITRYGEAGGIEAGGRSRPSRLYFRWAPAIQTVDILVSKESSGWNLAAHQLREGACSSVVLMKKMELLSCLVLVIEFFKRH